LDTYKTPIKRNITEFLGSLLEAHFNQKLTLDYLKKKLESYFDIQIRPGTFLELVCSTVFDKIGKNDSTSKFCVEFANDVLEKGKDTDRDWAEFEILYKEILALNEGIVPHWPPFLLTKFFTSQTSSIVQHIERFLPIWLQEKDKATNPISVSYIISQLIPIFSQINSCETLFNLLTQIIDSLTPDQVQEEIPNFCQIAAMIEIQLRKDKSIIDLLYKFCIMSKKINYDISNLLNSLLTPYMVMEMITKLEQEGVKNNVPNQDDDSAVWISIGKDYLHPKLESFITEKLQNLEDDQKLDQLKTAKFMPCQNVPPCQDCVFIMKFMTERRILVVLKNVDEIRTKHIELQVTPILGIC
jgi:hypothetical protein